MLQLNLGMHSYLFRVFSRARVGYDVDHHRSGFRLFRRHERPCLARFITYRKGARLIGRRRHVWCSAVHHSLLPIARFGPALCARSHFVHLALAAYIMAAFSALRLAKFNLDERQSMGFIGMPTPANALFWGSLIISCSDWLESYNFTFALLIILMLITSWLLISEIPMFALKFKHWGWKGNEIRYSFIGLSAAILIVSIINSGFKGLLQPWWIIIALYVLVSIISNKGAAAQAK